MRRTSDGRAFVGRRQFETCRDGRRCAVDGLATGLRRADNGLLTDYTRACLRTYDGRITGGTRTIHGLLTGGRWAGIRQTWTNPAITRWAAVWRTRTFHRFHARSSPAFTDAAQAATDETSVVPVAPQRTGHGLITDSTRAGGGISRGALRTTRPTTDEQQAAHERNTDSGHAGRVTLPRAAHIPSIPSPPPPRGE